MQSSMTQLWGSLHIPYCYFFTATMFKCFLVAYAVFSPASSIAISESSSPFLTPHPKRIPRLRRLRLPGPPSRGEVWRLCGDSHGEAMTIWEGDGEAIDTQGENPASGRSGEMMWNKLPWWNSAWLRKTIAGGGSWRTNKDTNNMVRAGSNVKMGELHSPQVSGMVPSRGSA